MAAAYCGHENISQQSILDSHFGHHLPANAEVVTKQHIHSINQDTTDLPMPLSLQDHHDHLPSCFHVVVTEAQQLLDTPVLRVQQSEQQYYWSNFYQSPHLSGLNPPPVLTPL